MVRIRENVIVNRAMATNRMIMRSMKFRAMIDAIGRAEDIMVLRTSAMRSTLLSLYRIIELLPAASPGVSFCRGQRQPLVDKSTCLCPACNDPGLRMPEWQGFRREMCEELTL